MMKKISIIIVTYNSVQDIVQCIDSIFQYNDIPNDELEVIIVDNSSVEVYEEMKFLLNKKFGNKILLFKNYKNGGYGQGNNFGIQQSSGNIICIANPDILFKEKMFLRVLNTFSNHKNLALIGGKQKGGLNISFWNRAEYDFFLLTAPLSMFLNKFNLYFEKFFYLSGALLFIDKKKFEKIGFFDEHIFLYNEESDITKRFLDCHYLTKFDSNLKYDHLIDGRNDTSDRSFHFLMDSTKIYLEKNGWTFKSYLNRKIRSYKMMILIYGLLGNVKKKQDSILFMKKFRELYKEC